MKLVRSTLLAVALSVGVCNAQAQAPEKKQVRGFDVGACAPKEFVAAHIEIGTDGLRILKLMPGPKTIIEIPDPVTYKLEKSDENGKLYVSGDYAILIMNIDKDGFLSGKMYVKGEYYALFYGFEADGSDDKLSQNAEREYQACVNVGRDQNSDDSVPKHSEMPKAEEAPDTVKI